jgi:ABC-2 type transport system permease protein/capsular polysaccharide transport system permease protein
MGTFPLRSLAIQLRVIRALLMREVLTRYGRHNIGFLWLFLEPMIFTLGVTALWTFTKATHGSNLPIVAFAITGYSSVLLWRNMPGRCIGGLGPNLSLMYHRNVRPLDVYLSRLILEAIGGTTSFLALCLVFIGVGWMAPPENFLKVAAGWVLLAWFGGSLALLLGALSQQYEVIDRLWHPVSYLTFPLSGAIFMVEWLPRAAREFVLYLPMVHGVELLREGYFGGLVRSHYDVWYVIAVCAGLNILALAQERRVSKKLVLE